MRYQRTEFCQQQFEVVYGLKPRHRWNEPPVLEWEELNWSFDQEQQLKQELGCLLAFVGELFVVQS